MTWYAAVTLVLFVAVPCAVLYGLSRLSRWLAGRRDPIGSGACRCGHAPDWHGIDGRCSGCACAEYRPLIVEPRWCKDGTRWMDVVDTQKVERAGERKWQETLRAQRKARKRPRSVLKNVVDIRRKRA